MPRNDLNEGHHSNSFLSQTLEKKNVLFNDHNEVHHSNQILRKSSEENVPNNDLNEEHHSNSTLSRFPRSKFAFE